MAVFYKDVSGGDICLCYDSCINFGQNIVILLAYWVIMTRGKLFGVKDNLYSFKYNSNRKFGHSVRISVTMAQKR